MKKRVLALVLAAVLLLSLLTGCSKKGPGANEPGKDAASDQKPSVVLKPQSNEEKAANTAKYAYQAEYLPLPEGIQWVNSICGYGNRLFFYASLNDGQKTETYTYTDENGEEHTEEYTYDNYRDALMVTDLDSGETTELSAYQLPQLSDVESGEAEDSGSSLSMMQVDSDGTLWVLCVRYSTTYDLPENFDPETDDEWNYAEWHTTSVFQHVSDTGETLGQFELQPTLPEGEDYFGEFTSFVVAGDYIYAADYQNVYLVDRQGNIAATIDNSEKGGNLAKLREDQIGLTMYEYDEAKQTGGYYFVPIDPAAMALSPDRIKVDADIWNIYPGDDVYDFYFNMNGNIFGYSLQTGTKEKVVDWMECDVDSNDMSGFTMLSDGRVAAIQSHWDSVGGNSTELVLLHRVEASQVHNKTVLTLACLYMDWDLRSKIVEFNKNSEDMRIVVKDYSEYNTEENYNAGLEKLGVEIMSGVIPDIFWTNSLPMRQYAARGILADLYPLIDADEGFSRESFLPQVLRALETDGKLYQIPQSFYVETAFGLDRVVGEYDTWTLDDLGDAMTKLREDATVFDQYFTKDTVLSSCLRRNFDYYVDWQNGKVNFDSESFIKQLEFANSFPEEYNWEDEGLVTKEAAVDLIEEPVERYETPTERMRSGKQLLTSMTIASFEDYIWSFYGGEFNAIGYPMEDGSYGSTFEFYRGMAISSVCEHPELAWRFISSMLTEQAQNELWEFPVTQAAFDKKVETIMTEEYYTDENGQPADWDGDGEPDKMPKGSYQIKEPDWDDPNFNYDDCYVEVYALTQEEVDFVLDIIDRTTHVSDYDEQIMNKVYEQTGAYFAGDKTAEEVAKNIQGSIGLYVMEQS